jgi:DNA-binding HxlR family transcriptional regulator
VGYICVMTTGYGQACPVARALDVIGEKWSLLILRDLRRKGPLRFQELEAGLPGVAPNTLSARLKALETQGVIATRLYERHPPRYEYFLTDRGKALGPVLKALYAWGERHGNPLAAIGRVPRR